MLFQNCVLLKNSRISPCACRKKYFVLKATGTGVSLHGATSKRDSMWHSAVFICISANCIPVNRIKITVVTNFEILVDLLSHRDHRPLHLIKFNVGASYRYNNICRRQETNLSNHKKFIIQPGERYSALEKWKIFLWFVSQQTYNLKTSLNVPGQKALRG